MGDESFYLIIVLLYTSSNYLEEPEDVNFLLITLSSEVAPPLDLSWDIQIFYTKYQRRPQVERNHNENIVYSVTGICTTHFYDSLLDHGIIQNLSFLKHFGLDGLRQERSPPFLFTIYMLNRVFCEDNSAKL